MNFKRYSNDRTTAVARKVVALTAASIALFSLPLFNTLADEECIRTPLSQQLALIAGGLVLPEHSGESVGATILVDLYRDRLLAIDESGYVSDVMGSEFPEPQGISDPNRQLNRIPRQLATHGDHRFVLYFEFESSLSPGVKAPPPQFFLAPVTQSLDLEEPIQVLEDLKPAFITSFQPTSSSTALFFSILGGSREPGIIYSIFEDGKKEENHQVFTVSKDDNENGYYYYLYSGMPYMAALADSRSYVLLFQHDEISLGTVEKSHDPSGATHFDSSPKPAEYRLQPLVEFPEEWKLLPVFSEEFRHLKDEGKGAFQETQTLQKIEQSTMAIALYAFGNDLFLLTKRAMWPNGDTEWTLRSLDPASGRELWSRSLPTLAPNITIIPDLTRWSVIEKARTVSPGLKGTPHVTTLSIAHAPASWFALELPAKSADLNCNWLY